MYTPPSINWPSKVTIPTTMREALQESDCSEMSEQEQNSNSDKETDQNLVVQEEENLCKLSKSQERLMPISANRLGFVQDFQNQDQLVYPKEKLKIQQEKDFEDESNEELTHQQESDLDNFIQVYKKYTAKTYQHFQKIFPSKLQALKLDKSGFLKFRVKNWLSGFEYAFLLRHYRAYIESQPNKYLIANCMHPPQIYDFPKGGQIYFIKGWHLREFGFPRNQDYIKKYKWKKMNFTTDLPKNNPLSTYLVASAKYEDVQLRMHVVTLSTEYSDLYRQPDILKNLRNEGSHVKLLKVDRNQKSERVLLCHIIKVINNTRRKRYSKRDVSSSETETESEIEEPVKVPPETKAQVCKVKQPTSSKIKVFQQEIKKEFPRTLNFSFEEGKLQEGIQNSVPSQILIDYTFKQVNDKVSLDQVAPLRVFINEFGKIQEGLKVNQLFEEEEIQLKPQCQPMYQANINHNTLFQENGNQIIQRESDQSGLNRNEPILIVKPDRRRCKRGYQQIKKSFKKPKNSYNRLVTQGYKRRYKKYNKKEKVLVNQEIQGFQDQQSQIIKPFNDNQLVNNKNEFTTPQFQRYYDYDSNRWMTTTGGTNYIQSRNQDSNTLQQNEKQYVQPISESLMGVKKHRKNNPNYLSRKDLDTVKKDLRGQLDKTIRKTKSNIQDLKDYCKQLDRRSAVQLDQTLNIKDEYEHKENLSSDLNHKVSLLDRVVEKSYIRQFQQRSTIQKDRQVSFGNQVKFEDVIQEAREKITVSDFTLCQSAKSSQHGNDLSKQLECKETLVPSHLLPSVSQQASLQNQESESNTQILIPHEHQRHLSNGLEQANQTQGSSYISLPLNQQNSNQVKSENHENYQRPDLLSGSLQPSKFDSDQFLMRNQKEKVSLGQPNIKKDNSQLALPNNSFDEHSSMNMSISKMIDNLNFLPPSSFFNQKFQQMPQSFETSTLKYDSFLKMNSQFYQQQQNQVPLLQNNYQNYINQNNSNSLVFHKQYEEYPQQQMPSSSDIDDLKSILAASHSKIDFFENFNKNNKELIESQSFPYPQHHFHVQQPLPGYQLQQNSNQQLSSSTPISVSCYIQPAFSQACPMNSQQDQYSDYSSQYRFAQPSALKYQHQHQRSFGTNFQQNRTMQANMQTSNNPLLQQQQFGKFVSLQLPLTQQTLIQPLNSLKNFGNQQPPQQILSQKHDYDQHQQI
eukprot:403356026